MSDYDLRYISAVNPILESYLLSRDLYWLPGITSKNGEPPYPSVTPGNLLLSFKRAEAVVSPQGRIELQKQQYQFERTRNRWLSAWKSKCNQDFRNRLGLWTRFLDELIDDPELNRDRFAFEVTRRVLLQLLQSELPGLELSDEQLLKLADQRLKTKLIPGAFIWAPDLSSAFPEEFFWYLYGTV